MVKDGVSAGGQSQEGGGRHVCSTVKVKLRLLDAHLSTCYTRWNDS